MISRRLFTKLIMAAGAATGAAFASLSPSAFAATVNKNKYPAVLGDNGLHHQPWFLDSFLELQDDLAEATEKKKRFAIIWEQRGCPYCRELHTVNLAREDINEWIQDNFTVLQLDLWGARMVTDFDGEELSEKDLARKWRVNFTPTIQYFPENLDGIAGKPGNDIEVARMPGYFKPFHFLSMFEYVREGVYKTTNFQRYLQDKFSAMKAKGVDPKVW